MPGGGKPTPSAGRAASEHRKRRSSMCSGPDGVLVVAEALAFVDQASVISHGGIADERTAVDLPDDKGTLSCRMFI